MAPFGKSEQPTPRRIFPKKTAAAADLLANDVQFRAQIGVRFPSRGRLFVFPNCQTIPPAVAAATPCARTRLVTLWPILPSLPGVPFVPTKTQTFQRSFHQWLLISVFVKPFIINFFSSFPEHLLNYFFPPGGWALSKVPGRRLISTTRRWQY